MHLTKMIQMLPLLRQSPQPVEKPSPMGRLFTQPPIWDASTANDPRYKDIIVDIYSPIAV